MRFGVQILCAALALLPAARPAFAAVLGLMPEDTIIGGEEIRVPVCLGETGDDVVAALQFDLKFDAPFLTFAGVEAGASAKAGEKSAHANLIRPGQIRVIVAGLNRNALPEGPVAWLAFSRTASAAPVTLGLGGAILSDPLGTAVTVRMSPDTLVIDPAAALAAASDSGAAPMASQGMAQLPPYRPLLFAAVVVGVLLFMSRRAPMKGRAR